MLRDVVQHQLAVQRGRAQQPHQTVQVVNAVFLGETVAAMGLDRRVNGVDAGFGTRVLGDVGKLPRQADPGRRPRRP